MAFLESFVKHSSGKFYYNLDNYAQAKLLYDELVKKGVELNGLDDVAANLAKFASDEGICSSLTGNYFRTQIYDLPRGDKKEFVKYVVFYYMPL